MPPEAALDARVEALARDAMRHVALYQRLWDGRPAGAFRDLPSLDKAALRAATLEERIHARRRHRRLARELSSGSSGEPLTVYSDPAAIRARRLAFLRALVGSGYRPGQRLLMLTSRREAGRSTLLRWHYASIAEDTEALARKLESIAPRTLYGPLSTLELLAGHFFARGVRPPSLRLVVSTAEQLTADRLAKLTAGFGAPVADFYGMSEFGLVAWRAPGADAYVPARASLALEFLPAEEDPALEHLVVTDLAERTCPLIRYETGDLVVRDRARAGWPIVAFAGRAFDCIVLPDGARLSPYRIDVALEHLPEVRAFEVVQQPDLSLDVTIDVPPHAIETVRPLIGERLAAAVNHALPFRIHAGSIRRGPPGTKFRPIRSLAGAGA